MKLQGDFQSAATQLEFSLGPIAPSVHTFLESATGLPLITGRKLGFLTTPKDNVSLSLYSSFIIGP